MPRPLGRHGQVHGPARKRQERRVIDGGSVKVFLCRHVFLRTPVPAQPQHRNRQHKHNDLHGKACRCFFFCVKKKKHKNSAVGGKKNGTRYKRDQNQKESEFKWPAYLKRATGESYEVGKIFSAILQLSGKKRKKNEKKKEKKNNYAARVFVPSASPPSLSWSLSLSVLSFLYLFSERVVFALGDGGTPVVLLEVHHGGNDGERQSSDLDQEEHNAVEHFGREARDVLHGHLA
jgi:hypothetical protein